VTAGNRVQVRVSPDLAAWLASRAERVTPPVSPHEQARTELALWRGALEAELRRLPPLTVAQASCIADAIGGPHLTPGIATAGGMLYHQVFDAFLLARRCGDVSSFGAKHAVREQEVLDYLEALSPVADHALADAFSRWWADVVPRESQPGDEEMGSWRADSAEGFAAAGLRVTDP
jgi:hypothetical protein